MECRALRSAGQELRAFEVAYYVASVDELDTLTRFARSLEADYPMLSDAGKVAARAYGVLLPVVGLPSRWTFVIGKDGRILAVDRAVKPATAGADLARQLETLGVPRRGAAPSP